VAGKASSSSSVTTVMRSRSASMTPGLNAAPTRRRKRVCLGGSFKSIHSWVVRSIVLSARKGRICP
jgi:hypothetical protein